MKIIVKLNIIYGFVLKYGRYRKRNIIKNLILWLKMAKEFAYSSIQEINELGHYLADNLLCKLCIFIAINEGRENEIWIYKKEKKTDQTLPHNKLYKTFLEKKKDFNIEPYKPNLKILHDKRNFYQHDPKSIEYGLRRADSITYVEKVEEIMNKIGIIKPYDNTKPTNYLRSSPVLTSISSKIKQDQEKWQKFYKTMSSNNRNNFGITIQEMLRSKIRQRDFAEVLKMDCGSGFDQYLKIYMNKKWQLQFESHRMTSPIRYEVKIINQLSGDFYDFSKPNDNRDVLDRWLNYIVECCGNEGIKIKI